MIIELPEDLERTIQSAVHEGQFTSIDEAMAEAVRLLIGRMNRPPTISADPIPVDLGSIGAMRDDADWLDQAMQHVMTVREERPWRLKTVE